MIIQKYIHSNNINPGLELVIHIQIVLKNVSNKLIINCMQEHNAMKFQIKTFLSFLMDKILKLFPLKVFKS